MSKDSKLCYACANEDHLAKFCPYDELREQFFAYLKKYHIKCSNYNPELDRQRFKRPLISSLPRQMDTHQQNFERINYDSPYNLQYQDRQRPDYHSSGPIHGEQYFNQLSSSPMFGNNFNMPSTISGFGSGGQHFLNQQYYQPREECFNNYKFDKDMRMKISNEISRTHLLSKPYRHKQKINGEELKQKKIGEKVKGKLSKISDEKTEECSSNNLQEILEKLPESNEKTDDESCEMIISSDNEDDNKQNEPVIVIPHLESLSQMKDYLDQKVKEKTDTSLLPTIKSVESTDNIITPNDQSETDLNGSNPIDKKQISINNSPIHRKVIFDDTNIVTNQTFQQFSLIKCKIEPFDFTFYEKDKDDRIIDFGELAKKNLAATQPMSKKIKLECEDLVFGLNVTSDEELKSNDSNENLPNDQSKKSPDINRLINSSANDHSLPEDLCLQKNRKKPLKLSSSQIFFQNGDVCMFVGLKSPIVKYQFTISPVDKFSNLIIADQNFISKVFEYKKKLCANFEKYDMRLIFVEHYSKLRPKERFEVICYPIASNRWERLGNLDGIKTYFDKGIISFRNEKEVQTNKINLNNKKKPIYEIIPQGLGYICINFGINDGFVYLFTNRECEEHFDKIPFADSTIFQFFYARKNCSKSIQNVQDAQQRSNEIKEILGEFINENKCK